jgi:hypothetical protein
MGSSKSKPRLNGRNDVINVGRVVHLDSENPSPVWSRHVDDSHVVVVGGRSDALGMRGVICNEVLSGDAIGGGPEVTKIVAIAGTEN